MEVGIGNSLRSILFEPDLIKLKNVRGCSERDSLLFCGRASRPSQQARVSLFNSYFGGGMGSVEKIEDLKYGITTQIMLEQV